MRMRFVLKISIMVFLLLSMATAHADDKTKAKLEKWLKRNGAPGVAVEVYNKGKVTTYYLGYADRENKKPITENTIFEIASITKLFTTILIADEIKNGGMKLTDPVSKYVSDLPVTTSNKLNHITIENLATHTSGFPFNAPKSVNSRKKLSSFFSRWKNPSPIGSQWLYSNINMGLLGFSLENLYHKTISELYAEKILDPLGMYSSGAMIPDRLMKNYAQGYNTGGKPAPRRNKKVWLSPPNSDWIFPATGVLKASAHDMLLFMKAALCLPGTPDYIADAMRFTQTPFMKTSRFQQGLAWMIHPDPFKNKSKLLKVRPKSGPHPTKTTYKNLSFNGNALMEKTGASGGFRSYIAVIPDEEIGVVLLVNRYIMSNELITMGRHLALNAD